MGKSLGIDIDIFNTLTRGYVLNLDIVFYKGNFNYDEEVIKNAKIYAKQIKEFCKIKERAKVYVGVKVGVGSVWPPDKFIMEI